MNLSSKRLAMLQPRSKPLTEVEIWTSSLGLSGLVPTCVLFGGIESFGSSVPSLILLLFLLLP
jgi:hypothetical protein